MKNKKVAPRIFSLALRSTATSQYEYLFNLQRLFQPRPGTPFGLCCTACFFATACLGAAGGWPVGRSRASHIRKVDDL